MRPFYHLLTIRIRYETKRYQNVSYCCFPRPVAQNHDLVNCLPLRCLEQDSQGHSESSTEKDGAVIPWKKFKQKFKFNLKQNNPNLILNNGSDYPYQTKVTLARRQNVCIAFVSYMYLIFHSKKWNTIHFSSSDFYQNLLQLHATLNLSLPSSYNRTLAVKSPFHRLISCW